MAKKHAKKKAAPKRTIILKVRKAKPFDFTREPTEAERQGMILALKSLTATEGWALLVQHLDLNIAALDKQIIEKKDLNGAVLEDKECDRLRDQRSVMDELRRKPTQLLTQLERTAQEEPNDDPYA